MNATSEHKLIGLEADNLLAFLALLGLLRALEAARPAWRPRVRWDVENPPTHPIVLLTDAVKQDTVADAASDGCDLLARAHDFGEKRDPDWNRAEARVLLSEVAALATPMKRGHADVLSALVSDGAMGKGESVAATPLCLLFGQGHQHFLDRFSAVAAQGSAPPRGKGKKATTPSAATTLAEALFRTWERIDQSQSFRWDPAEDRRYALRFGDPAKDVGLTVHGANRLAAIALPLLTVFPVASRGKPRLAAIGMSQSSNGAAQITWPIWSTPTSLNGILALLTHPALHGDRPGGSSLRVPGVYQLRRATRISVGKFFNFTRATVV